ncbi:MAG: 4-alpha-glucanotransferase [Comamonadaceae bacterium]|nr:MAG: 4-alpha-glucanotransferase [Comamonadaceae bacterium]
MNDEAIRTQAETAGIATRWRDVFGTEREVGVDTLRAMLKALELPAGFANVTLPPMLTCWSGEAALLPPGSWQDRQSYRLTLESGGAIDGQLSRTADGGAKTEVLSPENIPPGYHRLETGGRETTLAVAPRRCYSVADAVPENGRDASGGRRGAWGLAAQLYSLRRANGWGVGDFTALEQLAQSAASHGASALAISPVHAMFSADPQRFSPYGPSSRLFLNVLHIDPARVLGDDALAQAMRAFPGSEAAVARLEARPLIDWPAACKLKLTLLRQLFETFSQDALAQQAFDAFRAEGGEALQDHARYEALDAWLRQQQGNANQGDWRRWPVAYRDPRAATVQAFATTHAREVAFHQFLQWQAAKALHAAQAAAKDAGMAIGLVADLAVGADPGGSQAWGLQTAMLNGLTVGAPPDLLAPQGQDWGLGALSPHAMQALGFAPWLAMLRANMRASGGIRIDHVLGLMRLWLVPEGSKSSAGAYLHYPLDDLLRLTALESVRHQAIVIGEDLGTVPPGFSERLAAMGVLGIRALWFQREGNAFLPPESWPADAMATTSTHDLATIAGWWVGRDIDWRERLDLLGDSTGADQHRTRESEKTALWAALQDAGLAEGDQPADAPVEETLAFVGSTPAALVMVPLEDAIGLVEQPNLPGTVDVHPNWQQRLRENARTLLDTPATRRRLKVLDKARATAPQPKGDT